ncbi:hypothetical protein ANN_25197 [Periplaneta americana]|uniref:Uncharacterized protein n=1 Tax=Periplaneta americana TaxID=6978 RepID=A0ABQ8S0W9_PERAM|nr:hypothetical protein ANN_25197 [Periplaneta americana]
MPLDQHNTIVRAFRTSCVSVPRTEAWLLYIKYTIEPYGFEFCAAERTDREIVISRNYGLVIKYDTRVNLSSCSCYSRWTASQPVLCSSEASFETGVRLECVRSCVSVRSPEFECSGPQLGDLSSKFSGLSLKNIVRNGNIKIGDLSFEEVEKFKYLGGTVTNINDTREKIKHRINMGNACYYSVEKLFIIQSAVQKSES